MIYLILFGPLRKLAQGKLHTGQEEMRSNDAQERYMGGIHEGEAKLFFTFTAILTVLWLVYPVNFFLSPQGVNVWGQGVSSAIYTVSDVMAKVVYGSAILGGILAVERRARRYRDEGPQRQDGRQELESA